MSVLEEVSGLVEAGGYKEAVERLTAENRLNRSRELDRALLELRSEAFLQGSWASEPPPWPSPVPDQFAGQGIPEIRRDDLDVAAVRSGIEHHGSLIVKELISPQNVDTLRDNIDRVIDAYDAAESGTLGAELEGWYEPFDRGPSRDRAKKRQKGAMLTTDSPPALFDLLEVFQACGLSKVIHDFFGEQPMLITRKGTLRRVPHDVFTGGWHQDGAFMGEDIRALNIWIALTDCGVEAPGMDIVAKRLPGIVQTGSNFAKWATNPEAAKAVADGCTERPEFAAGDAIIFDHLCLHRTAATRKMTKTRYAIETWLVAPSTYDDKGVPILF